MVKLKKQIVSNSIANKRSYGNSNPVKYITAHQTGNTSPGADAQAHANIQSGLNPRKASWHETVDDGIAIQSFPNDAECWACTDGQGPGNTESYNVEICINSDSDYVQAVKNGAARVKAKMDEHGLGIDRVRQHHDWYDKNCPAQIRGNKAGISWQDFLSLVEGHEVDLEKTAKASRNYLQIGDRGPEVADMQELLIDLGYDLGGYGADGNFGESTEAGLMQFQDDQDLTIDGLYGKNSKRKLENMKPEHKEDKSDVIARFQSWLNSYTFNDINVDGLYGPKTRKAAVKAYQYECNKQFGSNLAVDGIWGPNTRAATVTVSRGAQGNITRIIQGTLYGLGYNAKGFDGIFGSGCESALKSFQKDEGLKADGVAGKKTFTHLFN